ncbi:MAG: tetraacyldisaccharide 4'-kinase [Planctomycetota bacterium]|nr:tetraacyldisaccharide 4'-kinase [Planctomycetota bacterium]
MILDHWRHRRREAAGEWPLRLPVPVISIGNITVGGTGKTPLTEAIARHWLGRGGHPGIVSRGYRGGADGNDEHRMLVRSLPGVPHQQHRCRHTAGLQLLAAHPELDLILVDDGFQHRRLHRDLDLVLIDARRPLAGGHCLPLGRLREPWHHLARADHLILTRVERCQGIELANTIGFLRQWFPSRPRTLASTEVAEVRSLGSAAIPPAGSRVVGFCGIGDPNSFQQTLTDHGWNLIGLESFRDHHRYRRSDLARLNRRAGQQGAVALVCTAKDAVKIEPLLSAGFVSRLPILVQEVTTAVDLEPILAEIGG